MSMPVKVLKLGSVEVSIWKSDKYENSFSFKFQKNYKTDDGWKNADFFNLTDLGNVSVLCDALLQKKVSEKKIEKKEEKPKDDFEDDVPF